MTGATAWERTSSFVFYFESSTKKSAVKAGCVRISDTISLRPPRAVFGEIRGQLWPRPHLHTTP